MSTKCHYHSSFVTAVCTVHICVKFSFEKHQRSFLLLFHLNALSKKTNKQTKMPIYLQDGSQFILMHTMPHSPKSISSAAMFQTDDADKC